MEEESVCPKMSDNVRQEKESCGTGILQIKAIPASKSCDVHE